MHKNMLQMQNVTKSFGGREILCGMNLFVECGIIYGLLGVNGAGKSTAFKMVTGLLRPTEGEITFSGTSVFGKDKGYLKEMGILIETGSRIEDKIQLQGDPDS